MNDIEELKGVIRYSHGVASKHVESVPVKEVFQGKTIWDGIVEVFDLENHPSESRVYAWSYETDNPNESKHHVTVLHTHPIKSAADAVRAFIIRESQKLGTEES